MFQAFTEKPDQTRLLSLNLSEIPKKSGWTHEKKFSPDPTERSVCRYNVTSLWWTASSCSPGSALCWLCVSCSSPPAREKNTFKSIRSHFPYCNRVVDSSLFWKSQSFLESRLIHCAWGSPCGDPQVSGVMSESEVSVLAVWCWMSVFENTSKYRRKKKYVCRFNLKDYFKNEWMNGVNSLMMQRLFL